MTGVEIFRLMVSISTESNMFGTESNSKLKVRRQQGASALAMRVTCNAQPNKLEI
jgi:hypothetical protein